MNSFDGFTCIGSSENGLVSSIWAFYAPFYREVFPKNSDWPFQSSQVCIEIFEFNEKEGERERR